jgi:hypothetical protein
LDGLAFSQLLEKSQITQANKGIKDELIEDGDGEYLGEL